jgi:hypothetical protein
MFETIKMRDVIKACVEWGGTCMGAGKGGESKEGRAVSKDVKVKQVNEGL